MSVDSPSNYQLRPIAEWDEEYVKQLPIDEFDWLDFKASPWLNIRGGGCLEELSKYVSAYANFDGGYLIIGVHDPRKKGAIVIDGGVRVDLVQGGIDSWLEDKIPNLADATLNRLEVRALHAKRIRVSNHTGVLPYHNSCPSERKRSTSGNEPQILHSVEQQTEFVKASRDNGHRWAPEASDRQGG